MSRTDAMERLEERLAEEPASRIFLALAEEYRKVGQLKKTIQILRDGLRHHPAYTAAQVALGRALVERGEAQEARYVLTHALRQAPENLLGQRLLKDLGGPIARGMWTEPEPEPEPEGTAERSAVHRRRAQDRDLEAPGKSRRHERPNSAASSGIESPATPPASAESLSWLGEEMPQVTDGAPRSTMHERLETPAPDMQGDGDAPHEVTGAVPEEPPAETWEASAPHTDMEEPGAQAREVGPAEGMDPGGEPEHVSLPAEAMPGAPVEEAAAFRDQEPDEGLFKRWFRRARSSKMEMQPGPPSDLEADPDIPASPEAAPVTAGEPFASAGQETPEGESTHGAEASVTAGETRSPAPDPSAGEVIWSPPGEAVDAFAEVPPPAPGTWEPDPGAHPSYESRAGAAAAPEPMATPSLPVAAAGGGAAHMSPLADAEAGRRLALASLCRRRGDLERAAAIYRSLLEADPALEEARLRLEDLCRPSIEAEDGAAAHHGARASLPAGSVTDPQTAARDQRMAMLKSWLTHIREEG